MTFGLTDNKFWVEFTSCRYEPADLKTESELYARELSEKYNNLVLSLSTGLDSQVVLHSFLNQGLKLKCAFMSLVGYNQRELEQLKILESNIDNFSIQIKDNIKSKFISELFYKEVKKFNE